MKPLILASTSRYRRQLLERLEIPFQARPPGVDETADAAESPLELAARLAHDKAHAIEASDAVVIGSDQVASLDGRMLRKPGDHATALEQLTACQGCYVDFHTAVTVRDCASQRIWQTVDFTRVLFERLPSAAVEAYLRRERPYDCAGGFKAEGLGIALFAAIESTDPTALIGLPLIWLARTLRKAGLEPLSDR